jgi:NAD(P)-dependent dehydrogenase (short-subunit alcohol dehydrogenase family)
VSKPVAIVTGAGTGIGQATAMMFADRGYDVIAVDLNEAALDWASARGITTVIGDVSEESTSERMVAAALEGFGRLDTVVLNAGIAKRTEWASPDVMDTFDQIMSVNVRSVVAGIRHAAPAMAARGGGSIVATASTSGLGGDPIRFAYNASKAAVINICRAAALDWGHAGVRVNAMGPGPTMTPILQGGRITPEHLEEFRRNIPLQRLGRPEEQAEVLYFLGSPASSFVTGAVFMCDGGVTANAGVFPPISIPLSEVHH